MKPSSESYFAAMNTPSGFKSFFSEIFDGVDELYIIKGGPGTGKSRFMKEIGKKAEAYGLFTEYFFCSSDPSSLDGIIIYEQTNGALYTSAVIDGTSPHVYEPRLTGIKEHILNFGEFWDTAKLRSRRDEIEKLTEAKKRAYSSVYSCLSAIGELDRMTLGLMGEAIDVTKLRAAVRRITDGIKKGKRYSENIRIRSAIGCDGSVTLKTYAEKATHKYAVTDLLFSADIFMTELKKALQEACASVQISYSPRSPSSPDAVYISESDTAIYVGSHGMSGEQNISMRRFILPEKTALYKPRLKDISKLRNETLKLMQRNFENIRTLHGETEKIYGSAMDFSQKEDFTERFSEKLFSHR